MQTESIQDSNLLLQTYVWFSSQNLIKNNMFIIKCITCYETVARKVSNEGRVRVSVLDRKQYLTLIIILLYHIIIRIVQKQKS